MVEKTMVERAEALRNYKTDLLRSFFKIIRSHGLSMREVSKLTKISHTKIWLWLRTYESNEEMKVKGRDAEIVEDFVRRVELLSPILEKVLKNWPEDQNAFFAHFMMDTAADVPDEEKLTAFIKRILRYIAFAPRRNVVRKFFFRL
jgi:hypothetical protein